MTTYKVYLNFGKTRTIKADLVTIDPTSIRFDTRATSGVPSVLVAYFPAHLVSEVIKQDVK